MGSCINAPNPLHIIKAFKKLFHIRLNINKAFMLSKWVYLYHVGRHILRMFAHWQIQGDSRRVYPTFDTV